MLIQDSIDELLLSLDIGQIEPSLIWPVLRTIAQSCERWQTSPNTTLPPARSSDNQRLLTELNREKEGGASHVIDVESHDDGASVTASHVTGHVTPEAVEEFFLQYHREKQYREKEGNLSDSSASKQDSHGGVDENEKDVEEEDPYNQRKELSPLSRTVVEVMQRCGHHMSMEPPTLRLVVMETLTHCMLALQHEQVSLNIYTPSQPLKYPSPRTNEEK